MIIMGGFGSSSLFKLLCFCCPASQRPLTNRGAVRRYHSFSGTEAPVSVSRRGSAANRHVNDKRTRNTKGKIYTYTQDRGSSESEGKKSQCSARIGNKLERGKKKNTPKEKSWQRAKLGDKKTKENTQNIREAPASRQVQVQGSKVGINNEERPCS